MRINETRSIFLMGKVCFREKSYGTKNAKFRFLTTEMATATENTVFQKTRSGIFEKNPIRILSFWGVVSVYELFKLKIINI